MMNRDDKVFYSVFMVAVLALAAAATAATPPANLSLKGIADWAIVGGHISSGTGVLPAVGAVGERYVDLSTPTAPIEYRSDGSNWRMISGGSGGTGTSDHAALSNLDYAGSGHTGFAASSDVPNNASFTLAELGTKPFSALTDTPTTIAGYGLTDAASTTALTDHANDTSDPHGADMSVSSSITVGSGTGDAYMYRIATGVVGIASYACVIPQAATPSATIATGTLWYDSNVNKLKCYDGSAWQDLW